MVSASLKRPSITTRTNISSLLYTPPRASAPSPQLLLDVSLIYADTERISNNGLGHKTRTRHTLKAAATNRLGLQIDDATTRTIHTHTLTHTHTHTHVVRTPALTE